ncbi:cullin binding [Ceratobasidium sp. AG-Ba]|nr:cullin binding [Ceratobasidium sp. AG-Ba]
MSSRVSSSQRDSLVTQFRSITDSSKDEASTYLKKHNYRLDAAVDAYYQASTDSSASPQKIATIFDQYKDSDGDNIGVDGTIRCRRVDSKWIYRRMEEARVCDTIPAMKAKIDQLRTKLSQDPAYFSKVYNYTFTFAKGEGARSISIETAIAYWTLLLDIGLSGPALPHAGWKEEYTQWWFEFLNEKGGKGISKDTWTMLPDFIKTIDSKFENHDLEAAWPSTIDDFVDWAKEKIQAGQA